MTQYFIENKSSVNILDSHFLYEGGEGKIFAKGKTVFKIYSDPKKMIPEKKIQELSLITDPNVIKPHRILHDSKKRKVGYTMAYIKNSHPLCKIFTLSFKNKNKISDSIVLNLIAKAQKTITHIHNKKCLIVDLNEMNCLVDHLFNEIYFIDVDSYQTPSFPATAIMESIRDRHNKNFNVDTDWFSFAILSFQMLIGIHPYKGKHLTVKALDDRMRQNISVLNKGVSIPKICKSIDIIPQGFKDWYKALFEDGKRMAPPDNFQEKIDIIITPSVISSNEKLEISLIKKYDDAIIGYMGYLDQNIIMTYKSIYLSEKEKIPSKTYTHISTTTQKNKIIFSKVNNDKQLIEFNTKINHTIAAEYIMTYDRRIYVKNQDKIGEIIFIESTKEPFATTKIVANVLENSTFLYEGCALQNLLGSWVVSIFPETGKSYQIFLNELVKYKIIEAKYDNRVLMVIANKKGEYDKFVFKFDNRFKGYETRKVKNIHYQGINFVVLDNGIGVCINESEELEIFSNKIKNNSLKVINNCGTIEGNMKLYKNGTSVLFAKEDTLYKITMKRE